MRKFIRWALTLVLVGVIAYSGYQIYTILHEYNKADVMQNDMMVYKPPQPPSGTPAPVADGTPAPTPAPTPIVNQSIIDAQRDINGDIVGWLTVPGTRVDYLFVQAEDNDFYLHRDLNKNYAYAGSIFMDCRNSADFSDFNTILYGHHMKNGSMFHNLQEFQEDDFFAAYQTGFIYLPYRNLTLEIFAYMVIEADDQMIYTTQPESFDGFVSYVKREARQYRDPGLTPDDRIVTLSTCGYEYEGARIVLLAKVVE